MFATYDCSQVPGFAAACLVVKPQSIFVRFRYRSTSIENTGDALPYDQFLHQAYVATAIETIQIIRELAGTGVF